MVKRKTSKSVRRGRKARPGRTGKTLPGRPAANKGLVTRSEAAAVLGVAPARINRWVEDGAPVAVRGTRGHSAYYALEALRAWKDSRAAQTSTSGLSLSEERAKLARAQREKCEMQNRLRTGEVVERSVAVAEGRTVIAALKARLLSLPRQAVMRGLVLREKEPAVRALVIEALREMSRWSLAAAERVAREAEKGRA